MKTLIFLILIFSGCSITSGYISEYRILTNIEKKVSNSQSCKDKSLIVGKVFSTNSLMSQKMRYVQGDYKEFSFTKSEWTQSPNASISDELLKSIRDTEIFKSVNSYKSRSKSNLILETNVEDFMQYFSEDSKTSYVNIELSVTLIDAMELSPISSTTFTKRVNVKSVNAKGGVEALNKALSELLVDVNNWLELECK